MQQLDVSALNQESFLEEPSLFRYGPAVLIAISFSMTAIGFAASVWRVGDGRSGEYVRAFGAAEALASSAQNSFVQNMDRVDQAAAVFAAAQTAREKSPATADAVTPFGMGPRGLVTQTIAFDVSGNVLEAATPVTPEQAKVAATARATQAGGTLTRTIAPAVRMTDESMVLPVSYRLPPGPAREIVFLVDVPQLTTTVRRALGTLGGWVLVQDRNGKALLQLTTLGGTTRLGPPSQPVYFRAEDAMKHPLDYRSSHLLASKTADNGQEVFATVGVTEEYALVGFERRVISTWVIAWALITIVLVFVVLTALAIRRFAKKERYLRGLATLDALTGLPNRRSFQALLSRHAGQALQSNKKLALLFLDIDNFKNVNDSVGHTIGDALLGHVATVLTAVCGPAAKVCRLSGDEFTVLLPDASAEQALAVGDAILVRLRLSQSVGGLMLRTRASIGISVLPDHATKGSDLMQFADTAMYRAKNGGRAQCQVYMPSMGAAIAAHAQTMRELEEAVRRGQLRLAYQPKFSMKDGAFTGCEALLRWKHPTQGFVSPSEFITQAESNGLIVDIGAWALDEALRQIREWHTEQGIWRQVAVNVSAVQLRDEGFVTFVQAALLKHEVPGAQLQLELTESVLALDIVRVAGMLQALRELGVSIAVDDFGTGFSSLGALQQFELDTLKLDRSFVSSVGTSKGAEMCRAVIQLGHALGLKVVAEGIESLEQLGTLAQLGCNEAQGYLFAMPLAPEFVAEYDAGAAETLAQSAAHPKVVKRADLILTRDRKGPEPTQSPKVA